MSEQLEAILSSAPTETNSVTKPRSKKKAQMASQEAQLLQEISLKLDRVVAVLAAQGKDKDKQIDILGAAGCESGFIGAVVGMTAPSVRKFQSRKRSKALDPGSASGEGPDVRDD
jgi:hypothetical protein